MELFIPTKIYFEKNAISLHKEEIKSLGSKAMIVTGGKSSKSNGSLSQLTQALEEAGIPFILFDKIEENPSLETVEKAALLACKENVDFFIGLGGGSPMDAAKAISLLCKNYSLGSQILFESEKLPYYPLLQIPTTSGTGSEVTPYSILTLHEKRTKQGISHRVYPRLAFVDYQFLKSVPAKGFISTCLDALAHLTESYLNTNSRTLNSFYAKEGLSVWGSFKEHLLNLHDGDNLEDSVYEGFMYASLLAGMAISHTGTSLPHGLSYTLTYERKVPHGRAAALFLPGYLRVFKDEEKTKDVLSLLSFASLKDFYAYLEDTLGRLSIPTSLWQEDCRRLLTNPAKLRNFPYPADQSLLDEIREFSLLDLY